jgi:hypothetical protein
VGFKSSKVMSIVGPDTIGKSTLILTMLGWGIRCNSPTCHIETENKEMEPERIDRCMDRNRELASAMRKTISFYQCFTILDMVDTVEKWLHTIRDPKTGPDGYVPIDITAIVAVDTFSKLMAPQEAVGYSFYNVGGPEMSDDKEKKKKSAAEKKDFSKPKKKDEVTELGSGSNMGHSKLAHQWCRRLSSLLTSHNALLIIGEQQNDKVDMSGGPGGGSVIPPEVREQANRTKIGGRAVNQSAAYQMVLSPKKIEYCTVRGERVAYQKIVKAAIMKTDGPPRKFEFAINLLNDEDTETHQTPALDFSLGLGELLKSGGLGLDPEKAGFWSCEALGLSNASTAEIAKAFYAREALVEQLSRSLGMRGYEKHARVMDLNPAFDAPAPPAEKEAS